MMQYFNVSGASKFGSAWTKCVKFLEKKQHVIKAKCDIIPRINELLQN